MYSEMYKLMKLYGSLADAEMLMLQTMQSGTHEYSAAEIAETRRNCLDYTDKERMLKNLLNSACKK